MRGRGRAWLLAAWCVLLPLLGAVWLIRAAAVQVENAAVYHDELWTAPAAVALLRQERLVPAQEARVLGLRVPLVTGPYQGAIKSWLTAPVLAVFGASPAVLRGIDVVLAVAYLVSLWWALGAVLDRRRAAAVFLLPLLDPGFLCFVPTDQGPFLLQGVFVTVAIGAVLRARRSGRRGHVLLAMVMASAALADKLTGAPVVAALVVVASWTLWPQPLRQLGDRQGLWRAALTALPLLPFAIYFARNGLGPMVQMTGLDAAPAESYLQRLGAGAVEFVRLMGHPYMAQAMTEVRLPQTGPSWFAWAGTLVWLVALVRGRDRFLPVLLLAAFFAFAAVPGLQRPWHFLALHPLFVLVVFAHGSAMLGRVALPAVLVVAAQGAHTGWLAMRHQQTHGGVNLTSTALHEVQAFLERRGARCVVGLSYSIVSPLYVLSMGELQPVDAAFGSFSADATPALLQHLDEPATCLVYRRCVATDTTTGTYLAWLNAGSDWVAAHAAPADPRLRTFVVRDPRGTEFGVLYRD